MTVLASYLPLVPLLAGIATGLFGWRRSTASCNVRFKIEVGIFRCNCAAT